MIPPFKSATSDMPQPGMPSLSATAEKIVRAKTEELVPLLVEKKTAAIREELLDELMRRFTTDEIIDRVSARSKFFGGLSKIGRINADTVDFLSPNAGNTVQSLAGSSGSSLVGFTQSGIGAVSTDSQTKMRELPATPIDTAAPSDGTDGTTKLNNLFTRSNVLLAPNAYTSTLGGINFQYKIEGSPSASLIATNAAAAYDFGVTRAGAVVRDVYIVAASVQAIGAVGSSMTDVTLDNLNITNTPGTDSHLGISINTALSGRWKVVSCTLSTGGYSLLLNDNTTGTGFVFLGNIITSGFADAIEVNSPTNRVQDGVIAANIAKASDNGVGVNSGFAIGIAAARNWAILGNVIPQGRREAIHIEDAVRTLAIVGNVGRDLKKNGVHLLPDPTGSARGSVVVGQNLEADSASSGFIGLANLSQPTAGAKSVTSITRSGQVATVTTAAAHGIAQGMTTTIAGATQTEYNIATTPNVTGPTTFTYNVNGSPATPATGTITSTGGSYFTQANVIVGNRVKDFDTGADSALGFTILSGNVLEEATTAGIAAGAGVIIGENLLSSQVGTPAALVTCGATGGLYGKVYSDKTPTAVMTKSSSAGVPAVLRGFCFPAAQYVHAGGTQDNIPVVTLPDYCRGRVVVKISKPGLSSFSYMSADIQWNGTTLITENLISRDVGVVASVAFTQVAGVLSYPLFIAAATVFDVNVDFSGEWVKY